MVDRGSYCCRDVLPYAAMITVECSNVGINTLFKAATQKGMSYYVFVVYSYALATLLLLPLLFIFRGPSVLPPFTLSLFFKICLLGLIGVSGNIFGYAGINYSSPTLSSAMSNLTPAYTFILAVIFRMEKLVLRSSSTQAKIIGTIVSISGAIVVVLYKGPTLFSTSPPSSSNQLNQPLVSSESNWVIGSLLLATEHLLFSIWYIVQGFFGSSFSTFVHTWGLHLKGPVFVSMFKPLSVAIAAAMGVIFLGDSLYLGSVVGAIIISIGFYTVMWAKAKEELGEEYGDGSLEYLSNQKVSLLQSSAVEET